MENGTWSLFELPEGEQALDCMWVLQTKFNSDGSVERLKARLVAKGFKQRPGFDYMETFAPTTRLATIRLILALAAQHDLKLRSIDFSSAFLNGDLEEDVYMTEPEGFPQGTPDQILKLRRFLYGLKQASRQ